jgi:hypothetical protein
LARNDAQRNSSARNDTFATTPSATTPSATTPSATHRRAMIPMISLLHVRLHCIACWDITCFAQ